MWMDIVGHDQVASRFSHVLRECRLAGTYLFVGPGGVGKRLFAKRLAQCLFCSSSAHNELAACGHCESCRLMLAGNHPDLLEVGLKADKRTLELEQLVGDREHRNRQGLCHDISLKPYLASRRVAIIDHADTLTTATANALLKTLEEPPPASLIVLVGTSESRQLPTIRSRSQVVRFAPLDAGEVERLLVENDLVTGPDVARSVAELADGSLDQAVAMASQELWQAHIASVELLDKPTIDSVRLAELVSQFTNAAGKEAGPRRTALIALLGLVARHYRQQLRANPHGSVARMSIRRIDRCLEAEYQVDRNAHLQTVVQSWADDLARA